MQQVKKRSCSQTASSKVIIVKVSTPQAYGTLYPTTQTDETIIPEGYNKVKLDVNGKSVLAYQKENSEFYLIYGLNIESGEKNLYKYDKLENTLQRYEVIQIEENNNLY